MRTKLVKRHYCDFCNKGGMVGASMLQHENTCLKNPNRACFLCEEGREKPVPMKDLLDAFFSDSFATMKKLRDLSVGCPACILATILQAKKDPRWNEEDDGFIKFDYKSEKDEYYAEIHAGDIF